MALTATQWTVTVEERTVQGKKHRNRVKMVLPTDGTYPSDGIPVPGRESLGMLRNLDYIIPFDWDATAYVPKYDLDNGTIRIFTTASTGGAELATTATVASTVLGTIYVEAIGW